MSTVLTDLRRAPRVGVTLRAGAYLLAAYVTAGGALLLYSNTIAGSGIWGDLSPLPWIAEGIGVSAMLLGGIRLWPAVTIGSYLVWGVLRHDPPISVAIDAFGEALSLVLVVHLLRIWNFHRRFDRLRDPFLLIAAALIGRLVAGNIDVATPLIAVWLDRSSVPADFLALVTVPGVPSPVIRPELLWALARFELNSVIGIVLAVPALVASREPLRRALRTRPAGVTWFATLVAAWCVVCFALPYAWSAWPLLILALMLVSWAAIDFGVMTAALCTLALCFSTAVAFTQRVGPLAAMSSGGGLAAAWGFIALLCCTGPVLATTLAARRRDLRRLQALAARNLHIFMGNPCPAWVTETATGRIILANDEATHRYGYTSAEFLSMRGRDLLADPEGAAGPVPPSADVITTPFVRHRTRDGRLIDVEVESTPLELSGRAVTLTYAIEMTDRQDLRRRLLAVADRERRRLAQELHDGLGQILTGLALGVQSLLTNLRRGAVLDRPGIAFIAQTTAKSELLLGQMTEGISPLEALNGDLVQALMHLPETLPPEQRARMTVVVEEEAPLRLSLERREHLYRIAQEAVANALKHARAGALTIRLHVDAVGVRVQIEDDGIGIEATHGQREGLGVRSMKLRAQALDAEFSVGPRDGGGTTVSVSCSQAEAAVADTPARPAASVKAAVGAPRADSRVTWLTDALKMAGVAAGCLLGAAVTLALAAAQDPSLAALTGARLAIPSLMTGAATAGMLWGGRRLWPGTLVGVTAASAIFQHAPIAMACIAGVVTTTACVAIVTLLRRHRFTLEFARWQDPVALVAIAATVFAVAEPIGAACLLAYAYLKPGSLNPAVTSLMTAASGEVPRVTAAFAVQMVRWWADAFTGIVLTVPAVVALPALRENLRGHLLEAGLWVACVSGWAVAMLGIPQAAALMPLLALGILLLVWASSRFGVAFASIGTLACAMTGVVGFALRRGALGAADPREGIVYVWGFLGVLASISLFIAALLGERDRSRHDLRVAGEWYKRLFDSDPRALWVHEARTGRVVAVNEQALRTFRFTPSRGRTPRLEQLLAPGAARRLLAAEASASRGPVEIRQPTAGREFVDLDVSFLPGVLDGRPVYVCFAQDVTERNALRRANVERTDVERRRLAAELRAALEGPLRRVQVAVRHLEEAIDHGIPVAPLIEALGAQVRDAAVACRQCAHRASPLQASAGDFVRAMQNLPQYVQEVGLPNYSVTTSLAVPLGLADEQAEHLYELVREAVSQCLAREPDSAIGVEVRSTPGAVQVAVAASAPGARPSAIAAIARGSAIRLRAMAMGARLWAQTGGDGAMRLVCECANAPAA